MHPSQNNSNNNNKNNFSKKKTYKNKIKFQLENSNKNILNRKDIMLSILKKF